MKLKYYLRGLGVGIILTIIITAFTTSGNSEALTDDEIMERATELGMVKEAAQTADTEENNAGPDDENLNVKDVTTDKEPDNSTKPQENRQDEVRASQNSEDALKQNKPQGPKQDESQDNEEAQQNEIQDNEAQSVVQIEVVDGEFSDEISHKLFVQNLVDNAKAFNTYLVESEFDKRITIGVHSIPQGASYEEIAQVLCSAPENP